MRPDQYMDALLLGASPNSLSAARSLGRTGLQVVIAETAADEAVRSSRYVTRFEQLEEADDVVIASRLMELTESHGNPFLLPTGDRFALLVARYQELLQKRYCFVCPSYAVLEAIIDKGKLYETARQNGIPHPRFHVVKDSSDIDIAVANVPTPCYVKPALAHHWRRFQSKFIKLERADSAADLQRILASFLEQGFVALPQEIIPGSDSEVFSVSTYIDRSGQCRGWRTKRKLRQWPLHAGNGSLQEICDQPEVAELGLRLLEIVGHRGPATVEFRRDERTGRFVLIEINARTILGQEMITRSGLDVPLLAYHDAKGKSLPVAGPSIPTRWVYFGSDYEAFRQLRRSGQLTTWRWLRSLVTCRAFAFLALDDLQPFLIRVRMWLSRQWKVLAVAAPS